MGFFSKHKWLIAIFSAVFIGLPQYIDSLWGLAERVSGADMMPDLTWAYGVTVPLAVIMLCVTFWASRKESKEKNASVLEKIKSDLVTMHTCEREAATKKALQSCSKEIAMRIGDDLVLLSTTMASFLLRFISNRDIDALIDFFKTIGNVADSNSYGLKVELTDNELYNSFRRDLAQKRIDLKMRKKKKAVVRENTYRVSALTYGLNSSILLRGILQAVPEGAISEEQRVKLVEIRIALEDIEPKGEKVLDLMLDNLDNVRWFSK